MKGIYLGACRAYHNNYDLDYNDIIKTSEHINVIGDMLQVDISKYDYVIATPPCNYYSRANYRRETSEYSQKTKHLLPKILEKLAVSDKLFIVENVRNCKLFTSCNIYALCDKYGIFSYEYGRHTYFTNVMINFSNVKQRQDFLNGGIKINYHDDFSKYREGGFNVHQVIEYWLQRVVVNG